MAGGVVAALAVSAVKAGHMVRYEDAVALFDVFNLGANLRNNASGFVTKDPRGFRDAVPFHDIASADATRHDFHEDFFFACFRGGDFLDSYVVVVIVKCC